MKKKYMFVLYGSHLVTLIFCAVLIFSTTAFAQSQLLPGNIRIVNQSGKPLPGHDTNTARVLIHFTSSKQDKSYFSTFVKKFHKHNVWKNTQAVIFTNNATGIQYNYNNSKTKVLLPKMNLHTAIVKVSTEGVDGYTIYPCRKKFTYYSNKKYTIIINAFMNKHVIVDKATQTIYSGGRPEKRLNAFYLKCSISVTK